MATAFITPTELSAFLGRDITSDDGAQSAVDMACATVETVAGQVVKEATSTILLDGTGTDVLILPGFPAASVTSVAVADAADTDYVLDNGMLFKTTGVWAKGRRNVEVKYKHGHTSSAIPDDVKMVALNLAGRLLVQAPKNALEETNGDVRIKYATAPTDLTANELRILRRHSGR